MFLAKKTDNKSMYNWGVLSSMASVGHLRVFKQNPWWQILFHQKGQVLGWHFDRPLPECWWWKIHGFSYLLIGCLRPGETVLNKTEGRDANDASGRKDTGMSMSTYRFLLLLSYSSVERKQRITEHACYWLVKGHRQPTGLELWRSAAEQVDNRSREICVTFLKKGILFSLEWGDVTLFALGLGERWFAGISFSSASKPVASMSIAIYRQTIQKSSGG